jgi:hypothetical protein
VLADTPPGEGETREKFLKKVEGEWGMFSSKLELHDATNPVDNPLGTRKWEHEHKLQVPLTGPVFVVGQVNATCTSMDSQEMKVIGKTGLGCKVSPWSRWELQLRGLTAVTYDDTSRASPTREQSELLLELEARCPLAGLVNLEYQTTAAPALTVTEHDRLKQDLHLAFPLGALGKFSVGAKHSWENTPTPHPWTEGMQLYIGVDLKR